MANSDFVINNGVLVKHVVTSADVIIPERIRN